MTKTLEDYYTGLSWRERQELYKKYLNRQDMLERKAEHDYEIKRDNELTEGSDFNDWTHPTH